MWADVQMHMRKLKNKILNSNKAIWLVQLKKDLT